MKKRRSRITASVLSLILAFGSSGVVFAAESSDDGSDDITILYTNDVHSYIDESITYSKIASYKDSLENVLLVDAGDHIQGTAYGSMDEGETIIELMNATGYDLATLGNHEFDYDMDGAMKTIENADFDYVSCNFYDISSGSSETVLDSYEVFEVDGVKIAFVGITTPESITKSTPAYFQDDDGNYIYDIAGGSDGSELYKAVQTAIDAASEEADLVIALGHLGVDASSSPWTSEEVIANTTGLDAFIDGHSHTTMESETVSDADGNSVVLTQTGCYLDNLGQMTITANEDGTYSISTELLSADDLEGVAKDSEVSAIEDEWIKSVDEQLGESIAESDIEFTIYDENGNRLIRTNETNMGDLNADAYYWYINEVANIDCDVAIMNGGGIRASAEAGEWTYLTCKTINTFGNVLCVVEVSGQDILDALEFGARYTAGDASDEDNAECGGFLQVAGLTYKVDTSVENTITEDENSIWVSGPTEYRVYDVEIYDQETGEYEPLDVDATYNLGGTNYTLRDCGDGFDMFSDSYLVLDGICEDYLALAAYVAAFTDTDDDGLGNIATVNSPLASYENYLLDYETSTGAGRIYISDEAAHEYEAVVTEPTCTEAGYTTYTCSICGDTYTGDETAALGHSYEADSWTWSDDYSTASVKVVCSVCGDTQTLDAVVRSAEQEDGSVVYTASAVLDDAEYTDSVTVKDETDEEADDESSEETAYEIIDGADQTIKRGEDLTVKASGELDKFEGLLIDGESLDADVYAVVSGSTVATVSSEYLDTLEIGSHTLTFSYTDGSAETTFTLAEAAENSGSVSESGDESTDSSDSSSDASVTDETAADETSSNAETGDSSNLVLWILIAAFAAMGCASVGAKRKMSGV